MLRSRALANELRHTILNGRWPGFNQYIGDKAKLAERIPEPTESDLIIKGPPKNIMKMFGAETTNPSATWHGKPADSALFLNRFCAGCNRR